jgi:thiazole synthase ThiGH ThiG subunit
MTSLVSAVTMVSSATKIVTIFMVTFVTMIALITNVTIGFIVDGKVGDPTDQCSVVKMVITAVVINFVTKLRFVNVKPITTVVFTIYTTCFGV